MVQVAFKLGQLGKISRNGVKEAGVVAVHGVMVRPGGEKSFLDQETM